MADDKKSKEVETITSTDKPVFFWQAVEFESSSKSKSWYLYLILIALAVIGIFIWQKQWFGAAVAAVAVFALWSQARVSGRKKSYAIYDQGVTIDQKVYAFDQFKSFWIFPYQDRVILRFSQVRRFALPVEMPIDNENPEQIRLFLTKHLPEDENKGEDITDKVNRWIKF